MTTANGTPTTTELSRLAAEDLFVRQIITHVRSGAGCSLDAAVRLVKEFVADLGDPAQLARVDEAAEKIRELARRTALLTDPRGLIVAGRPSWYPGPREADRHWPRLRELLIGEGWDRDAIESLDGASTKVLAHLADPHEDEFARKGLVLGYVQSGKTTNFTALIAKAADAGYSFFIVLSGIHNGLRQQTQDRLSGQLWNQSRPYWHRLTDEDDFRPTSSVDAMLMAGDQKILAVVKKNGPRLRALKRWLEDAHRETLARCPVLIIDDESDLASVNTAKPDRQPRVINKLIRQIIMALPKIGYVGYSATPFANVLIDPSVSEDLFPRDFIIDLPRPQGYVGPEVIFGREPLEFDGSGENADAGEHDLIREVPESELPDLKPAGPADRWDFQPTITASLGEAIRYFVMSTAARRARALGNRHATMLVHTSQFTSVHASMSGEIERYVVDLADRLAESNDAVLGALRQQWEEECTRVPADEFEHDEVVWGELVPKLPEVLGEVKIIQDNSRSEDRLYYAAGPQTVIAVGGNTLSRGLTLEGLSVSFFVRSASAYDTLLQMGRWFGYRYGYADLTRIWMTDEMRAWFRHLATVEQELRYDIERYEAEHLTPLDLAPRIRTHPKMAITAAAKMQAAVAAQVSYSGRRLQTILFNHRDRNWLEQNLAAGRELLNAIRGDAGEPRRIRAGMHAFRGVPSEMVLAFLDAYAFHDNSRDLNSAAIRAYVERRIREGELQEFSVVVLGLPAAKPQLGELDLGLASPVPCINRARLAHVDRTYADIKSLMSRNDRVVDLELPRQEVLSMDIATLSQARNAPPVGRGDGSGLVALYPISKDSEPDRGRSRKPLEAEEHVLGVGLVFPTSASEAEGVDYMTVNLSDVPREEPTDEDDIEEDEESVAA